MSPGQSAGRPGTYHHGDLHRTLLEEAVRAIAEVGPGSVSLRELARRAGVSHAAPAHHFGDKAGLLTAVAAEGFGLLAAALDTARRQADGFVDMAVAYVGFAAANRGYFEVMFRPELYRGDDPAVVAGMEEARGILYGGVRRMAAGDRDFDVLRAGVAAWSLVHGLAALWLDGNLPRSLGGDPEDIARGVAGYLFRPAPAPDAGEA